MTGIVDELAALFKNRWKKKRNEPFLRAAMAACAMVSISDGHVYFCDRIRLDQIMTTLDKLKIFDPHEGVNLFNYYNDLIAKSPKVGHRKALAAVQDVASDGEIAELLIRLCLAISLSDGKTSLVEHIEIVSLCSLIGVDPEKIGLKMDKMLASVNVDD